MVSSLHPTANLSLTCCLTGSDIYISLYLSPLRDFCMKNILVWPIYHWALTHVAPSKKYPLLLNHKNCSFASSDAPNSFQPFKTDILLNHKKKVRSRSPVLCASLTNKDRDKLLPVFSNSFPLASHLVVHECKRKQPKESSPKISSCSSNCSQQWGRWGRKTCLVRTTWFFYLNFALFLRSLRM